MTADDIFVAVILGLAVLILLDGWRSINKGQEQ